LEAAIKKVTKREGAPVRPVLDPSDEFPVARSPSARQQEMEAGLLELQAEIVNRESLVAERERKLAEREMELNEREALLEAHRKVFESRAGQRKPDLPSEEARLEREALDKWRIELEAQEASLQESRTLLREREAYIEECENRLVQQSMQLSEREAWVEQREEDAGLDRS
jgi:hypothetical protein